MFVVLYALDKPQSLELRLAHRQAHLDYIAKTGVVRAAGPLLAEDGTTMIGSLIILETDDLAAAKAWAADDPYGKAGLFRVVDIRPWKRVIGSP